MRCFSPCFRPLRGPFLWPGTWTVPGFVQGRLLLFAYLFVNIFQFRCDCEVLRHISAELTESVLVVVPLFRFRAKRSGIY